MTEENFRRKVRRRTAEGFAKRVVDAFLASTPITDVTHVARECCDYLENHTDLSREYFALDQLLQREVNKKIGRKIKHRLHLKNGHRNKSPNSRIINSYTRHYLRVTLGGVPVTEIA